MNEKKRKKPVSNSDPKIGKPAEKPTEKAATPTDKTSAKTDAKPADASKNSAPFKAVTAKKSKKNNLPMYIVLGVLAFLLVLTVAIYIFFHHSKPTIDNESPFVNPPVTDNNDDPDNPDSIQQPQRPASADGRKQNMYNLMLIGKDYWSGSTDVIMLVSINTQKNDISVMQIPRDSTVDCGVNANHGKRVNAIFAYAREALRAAAANPSKEYDDPVMAKIAPQYISSLKDTKDSKNQEYNDQLRDKMALEYLKETLKQTFCIAIDGYAMVDVAGFREIVDILGGVYVDVPQDMDYEDPTQHLYIHLKAGPQTLNGSDAEGFVRFRAGYVDADIGRMNAQKIFLSALAKKAMSFSTVTKVQPLLEACMDYTTTSLSITDMIGYCKILLGMDLNNIKFYTAPGEAYQTSSGAWYYSLYMDENLQLINEHFNDYDRVVTPDDVTLNEVVKKYNISYNNQGISAQEINETDKNLTKSSVTYNPPSSSSSGKSNNNGGSSNNTSSGSNTQPTQPSTPVVSTPTTPSQPNDEPEQTPDEPTVDTQPDPSVQVITDDTDPDLQEQTEPADQTPDEQPQGDGGEDLTPSQPDEQQPAEPSNDQPEVPGSDTPSEGETQIVIDGTEAQQGELPDLQTEIVPAEDTPIEQAPSEQQDAPNQDTDTEV